jgi:putative endonuclease
MTNYARTVLYIGVTSNIQTRVWQHKNGEGGVFTSTYKCHYLLHYEEYTNINDAIGREKNLKNWRREWKENLIKKENPELKDLAADWFRESADAETSSA